VDQPEAVQRVIGFLNRERISYAVVGSVAAMIYGQPRLTNDIDILADIRFKHVTPFLTEFPGPDWYVSELGMRDAITNRRMFNVLHMGSGHKADIVLPRDDWQFRELERSADRHLDPHLIGRVAHPNDVIIGKLQFYAEGASPKHLRDIQEMISGDSAHLLDYKEIEAHAERLGVRQVWRDLVHSKSSIPPLPPDFPS
jgi:hypothetical protein